MNLDGEAVQSAKDKKKKKSFQFHNIKNVFLTMNGAVNPGMHCLVFNNYSQIITSFVFI